MDNTERREPRAELAIPIKFGGRVSVAGCAILGPLWL